MAYRETAILVLPMLEKGKYLAYLPPASSTSVSVDYCRLTAHIIRGRRKQLAPWSGDKWCQKAKKIMFLCTMGRHLLLVLLLLTSIGIEVEEKHITRDEKCFCNLSREAEKGGSTTMMKGQGPKLISKTAVRVEMGG